MSNPAIKPSLPKGVRDFLPAQMIQRQYVIGKIRTIFERYGYQPMETPSLERLRILSGKYGDEGERLIFKLLRRGTGLEELLHGRDTFVVDSYGQLVDEALRYDLTVPLSRVVAMHQNEITLPFKRYQIQPVWRADRPQKGRYREFYQCDVDAVGSGSMLVDAETVAIVNDVLTELGFTNFLIRLNNRNLLNGILASIGLDPARSAPVFIAIDKLEKIGVDGVSRELIGCGLEAGEAQKLLDILGVQGSPQSVLDEVASLCGDDENVRAGREELQDVLTALAQMGVPAANFKLDLYLVRGLGYYTGLIQESIVLEPKIGSLTGGGRYDKLIGMFLGRDVPACGVSFGIERIIDVMVETGMLPKTGTNTQVLVSIFDQTTQSASVALAMKLREAGIRTELAYESTKLKKQFSLADKKRIPFVAVIGPEEVAEGRVTLKNMQTGEQKRVSEAEAVKLLLDTAV